MCILHAIHDIMNYVQYAHNLEWKKGVITMKAAIVKEKGTIPVMGLYDSPVATEGQVIINVAATALSRVSKFRSMGMHYSSEANFPVILKYRRCWNFGRWVTCLLCAA